MPGEVSGRYRRSTEEGSRIAMDSGQRKVEDGYREQYLRRQMLFSLFSLYHGFVRRMAVLGEGIGVYKDLPRHRSFPASSWSIPATSPFLYAHLVRLNPISVTFSHARRSYPRSSYRLWLKSDRKGRSLSPFESQNSIRYLPQSLSWGSASLNTVFSILTPYPVAARRRMESMDPGIDSHFVIFPLPSNTVHRCSLMLPNFPLQPHSHFRTEFILG
ncbi:hypothetical protein K474DRAFT_1082988 [Panus rudis PR-1116 ss-1]|nr:hypothetical protein K474DRAFT_1082988 [Panus rudis PR-1116 ss-1]